MKIFKTCLLTAVFSVLMTEERAGSALVMTISVLEVWETPESLQVTCKKAAGYIYLQPEEG